MRRIKDCDIIINWEERFHSEFEAMEADRRVHVHNDYWGQLTEGEMDTPNDEELSIVFDRLQDIRRTREHPTYPFGLNNPSADIYVIVHEHSRLMNGGLSFFFEHDPVGNMDYPSIADVYRRIGAKDTAEWIVLAANMFPFPEPHLRCDDRQEFMYQDSLKIDAAIEELGLEPSEYPKALFDDLDDRIFEEMPSGKVFAYMRRNLEHLPFKK